MKEIEEKLAELQGQHSDLTRSYEALQVEYASVKQELDLLRRRHESHSPEGSYVASSIREWEECRTEPTDPLLFDVSAFCYEPEDEGEQKGERG
jgi:AP-1-like factor